MKRVSRKDSLSLVLIGLLMFGLSGVVWALCPEPYNRPNPLMDYVSQEIGIYDTAYEVLTETDCRGCHGQSVAQRHHHTPIVLEQGSCLACHELCTRGVDPGCPPGGVYVIRNCLESLCHSVADRGPKDNSRSDSNGWHHATDLSSPENCVVCHSPNLIGEIVPVDLIPPSPLASPVTPFSCENCHWEQEGSVTGDPDHPGHPSTYDHMDADGQPAGFHEYGLPIAGVSASHHFGPASGINSSCESCHGADPRLGSPDWNPYDPDLMRYCQTCHDVCSLHESICHLEQANGWEAVGFHVPSGNDDCADVAPSAYRTWNPPPHYLPESQPGFTADQMCLGCHEVAPVEPLDPDCPPCTPVIHGTGDGYIQANAGSPGAIVTVRGECFGDTHRYMAGSSVQFGPMPEGDVWVEMPIHSWTDSLIEFEIPYFTLAAINYWVKVKTPTGESNRVVFSELDYP